MSKIAGIRPEIRHPVFKMAGYPAKLLSGPSLVIIYDRKSHDISLSSLSLSISIIPQHFYVVFIDKFIGYNVIIFFSRELIVFCFSFVFVK